MKGILALAVVVLAVSVPQMADASVAANYVTIGNWTTYIYTYTNTEEPTDIITAFHVYAPTNPSLITDWDADAGWSFDADLDQMSNGSDIYWYAESVDGVGFGESVEVSMTTPASVGTLENYVLPDFPLGNWGYETISWPGFGVFVMMPSIPVPGAGATVPEPCSAAALIGCIGCLLARRRR